MGMLLEDGGQTPQAFGTGGPAVRGHAHATLRGRRAGEGGPQVAPAAGDLDLHYAQPAGNAEFTRTPDTGMEAEPGHVPSGPVTGVKDRRTVGDLYQDAIDP